MGEFHFVMEEARHPPPTPIPTTNKVLVAPFPLFSLQYKKCCLKLVNLRTSYLAPLSNVSYIITHAFYAGTLNQNVSLVVDYKEMIV